jgi:hypothetical protein
MTSVCTRGAFQWLCWPSLGEKKKKHIIWKDMQAYLYVQTASMENVFIYMVILQR